MKSYLLLFLLIILLYKNLALTSNIALSIIITMKQIKQTPTKKVYNNKLFILKFEKHTTKKNLKLNLKIQFK